MQNHHNTRRWALTGVSLGAMTIGSCGLLPVTSDVPCLRPTAWSAQELLFVVRTAASNPDDLLLAARTVDQSIAGEGDHGAVYRFHAETGRFDLVDDSEWDSLESTIYGCPTLGDVGPFIVLAGRLRYEDSVRSVAGGTAMKAVSALDRPITAVLSATGPAPIPFLGSNSTTGQHFHRLYSDADGTPLGPALRLGLGSAGDSIVMVCWVADRYVIYSERRSGVWQLCVVFVGDQIDQLSGDVP